MTTIIISMVVVVSLLHRASGTTTTTTPHLLLLVLPPPPLFPPLVSTVTTLLLLLSTITNSSNSKHRARLEPKDQRRSSRRLHRLLLIPIPRPRPPTTSVRSVNASMSAPITLPVTCAPMRMPASTSALDVRSASIERKYYSYTSTSYTPPPLRSAVPPPERMEHLPPLSSSLCLPMPTSGSSTHRPPFRSSHFWSDVMYTSNTVTNFSSHIYQRPTHSSRDNTRQRQRW